MYIIIIVEGYLHGSAFTGDQREAYNVREVHGDGREQLRLHVLSGLQVVSYCPVKHKHYLRTQPNWH